MTNYGWKSLEWDIEMLIKKAHFLRQPEIKTIRDFLDYTWGLFKAFPGIGGKAHERIETELRRRFGIDIDEYLVSAPPTAKVPDPVRRFCFDTPILIKNDLKRLSRAEIMRSAFYDLIFTKRIIKMLDAMGIRHLEPGDIILLEAADLQSRIKNQLFAQGYFTERDALSMTENEINSLYSIGPSSIDALKKWQARRIVEKRTVE